MLNMKGCRLLIVDDEPRNTRLLADIFKTQGFDVLELNQSLDVVNAVASYEPDLIILDVMMPGLTGFELTREIKSHDSWVHIPIILLTALADRDSCIEGLECGAEDYVCKPFNRRELTARVNSLLRLKKLHDFQYQNVRLLEEYDGPTGLPKRDILLQFAESLFAKKEKQRICVAICEVEFDQYLIGPLSGGDRSQFESQVCHTVVERMSGIFPPGILLGCLGVGKFGIILEAVEEVALTQLRLLQHRLSQPVLLQGKEFFLKFAIGYVPPPLQSKNWKNLFNQAEITLLAAKKEGPNLIKKFVPELDSENYERWWISQALFQALRKQQLEVYYQPQVDIRHRAMVGFEALLRWHHPEKGDISPARFIPLAEENGLIYDIGLWVIEEVCKRIAQWRALGRHLPVAINVSAMQLHRDEFTEDVFNILERYHLDLSDIEIELTESSLIDPNSGKQLRLLWQKGVEIAIDDFGTGYCNLEYLKKYSFNRLKIDRSFIVNICESSDDVAIVKAIVAIAENMGLKVIAEGTESLDQLHKLLELGCYEVQGYYFSKPVCAGEATHMIFHGLDNLQIPFKTTSAVIPG